MAGSRGVNVENGILLKIYPPDSPERQYSGTYQTAGAASFPSFDWCLNITPADQENVCLSLDITTNKDICAFKDCEMWLEETMRRKRYRRICK